MSGKLTNNQKLAHFIETHFNEEHLRNVMNYIKFTIKSPGTIRLQKCNQILIPCNTEHDIVVACAQFGFSEYLQEQNLIR